MPLTSLMTNMFLTFSYVSVLANLNFLKQLSSFTFNIKAKKILTDYFIILSAQLPMTNQHTKMSLMPYNYYPKSVQRDMYQEIGFLYMNCFALILGSSQNDQSLRAIVNEFSLSSISKICVLVTTTTTLVRMGRDGGLNI